MNELEQKPKLNIHVVSSSDYRVEEYDGTFQIQRKKVIKKNYWCIMMEFTAKKRLLKHLPHTKNRMKAM